MKLLNIDVIDLMVFDEHEKLITKLDSLNESKIFTDETGYKLGVSDTLMNIPMQKFLHKEEKLTDFQIAAKGNKTTLRIGAPKSLRCKLVGNGYFYDPDTTKPVSMSFEVNNARIYNNFELYKSNIEGQRFEYVFVLLVDENGDFLKLHINN